ncbi:MAG TPA: cytochrome c biogenesis protein CcdA [Thermoanaerobaculia bacterium]|nr:cytochrome c biogenesis protein CcdA [Thermoanaerobaculia bacterium]
MKRQYAVLLAFLAFAVVPAFSQLGGFGGPDAQPKASITGSIHTRNGDDVEGTIVATIESGWHVNSNKPTEEFAIPTVLALDPATADLTDARFPQHQMKAFEFTGGKQLAVFDGTFPIGFRAKLKPGATKIDAKLNFQACSDRVCLPPNVASATIDISKLTPAPAATATAAPSSANFTPLTAAPKDAKAKSSLLSSDVSGTLAERGLPLTLLAIFILGLALNLTPCVYPLIPITIGFFSQQSGSSTGRRAALSSAYVLGIAITYSTLGVFSAISGKLFGAWLQHPAVLIFFALLMLVMASSMFGAFEMQAPQFISKHSGGQSGVLGALTMGLVIGIVAAPCVGPFVISLIALVSSLQSPLLGFLMFFVLALGLGLPYLFLGIFSSGISAIPRSGMWMLQVKKAMGFILIAMAFYFLRPLIGDFAFQYGVAASLLIGAAFLFFSRSQGAHVWRIAIAILLLAGGVAFAIPRKHEGGPTWQKYDANAIAAAKAAGKPVIIDFYADWCLPCKELDEKTFSDAKIAGELDRFVRIKADLTVPSDAKTQALTRQYAILGVPTIVLIDTQGNEVRAERVTGFEPPDVFLQHLQKVK